MKTGEDGLILNHVATDDIIIGTFCIVVDQILLISLDTVCVI